MTWIYRTCMVVLGALIFYNLQDLTQSACDPACETCMEKMCPHCDRDFIFNTQCQQCWYPYCQTCSSYSYECDRCINSSLTSKPYCDYRYVCYKLCMHYDMGREICGFSNNTCYVCKDGYFLNQTTCVRCTYSACQTCTDATNCKTCKNGYWGEHCDSACSSGCLHNMCNMTDGSCECKEGYFGESCQHVCAHTCASSSMGTNKTLCNSITGECHNCKTGYFGQFCNFSCSPKCSMSECDQISGKCRACPLNESHGNVCEKRCSHLCRDSQCHVESGSCSLGCIPTHYGPQCEFTCSTYCKGTENWVVCDANGACLGGCVDGYSGDKCLTETPGMVVVVAVVATIALIAIIFLIVVIVVLVRRGVMCPSKTRCAAQTESYQNLSTNRMEPTYQTVDHNQGNYENTEAEASAPGVSVISDQVYYNADK